MKLPMMDALTGRDTGRRLAPRLDTKMGLYMESETAVDCYPTAFRRVFQMEARIGTQYTVDEGLAGRQYTTHVENLMRGRVLEHVYGPIYEELRKHLYDLMDEGIRGPVLDRLTKMLKDFEDAFRGQPTHD